MILADTSFLIRALLKGTAEDRALRRWLRTSEPVATSAIAWAEFLCGPLDAEDHELASGVVGVRIDFGDQEAAAAARLYNQSGRRRGTLIDCMIAATAIRTNAGLATANRTDFRRLEPFGLRLVDY